MTLWFRNLGCAVFMVSLLILLLSLAALGLVVAAAHLIR